MTTTQTSRLTRRFYRREPAELARALLGQTLVRVLDNGPRLAGRIVETEAYLGAPDRAAHTFGARRTPRNETMWLDGGHAYVYFTYGMHHCVNVVAQRNGQPTACLVRALEPLEGLDVMHAHRTAKRHGAKLKTTDLASGPAKLCQALAIDRQLDGLDLTTDTRLWIEKAPPVSHNNIATSARIGVQYAGDWADKPLRFFIRDNPHVSV
ncbi:MAG: DNA-3-methyladenine glycosylase [Planctomycetota bacterium]